MWRSRVVLVCVALVVIAAAALVPRPAAAARFVARGDGDAGRADVAPPPVHPRVFPHVNLDHWVFDVENLLEVVVVQGRSVVVVRDVAAEAVSDVSLAIRETTASVAHEHPSVVLAFTTDSVNPFVRLATYFGWSSGATHHYLVGPCSSEPARPQQWWTTALPQSTDPAILRDAITEDIRRHSRGCDATTTERTAAAVMRPCAAGFSIYIYPDDGRSVLTTMYQRFLQNIRARAMTTDDPSQACVFIPPFDTTPLPSKFLRGSFAWFGDDGSNVTSWLRALPYWNGGVNHIVLDWTDSRSRFFHTDAAIVWKSGYDQQQYRRGHDVAFPLFPNVVANTSTRRAPFFQTRPLLVSFKGTLWSYSLGKPPFDVRQELLQLHNGDDIVVVDKASSEAAHYDYLDLLSRSRFGLVPRGGGLHSYRFVEVLAAGAIPVVLADDWVIPFVEVLRPDMYVVRVAEREAHNLRHILLSIPPERVGQLAANAHMAYETCFRDTSATALSITQARLLALQPAPSV